MPGDAALQGALRAGECAGPAPGSSVTLRALPDGAASAAVLLRLSAHELELEPNPAGLAPGHQVEIAFGPLLYWGECLSVSGGQALIWVSSSLDTARVAAERAVWE